MPVLEGTCLNLGFMTYARMHRQLRLDQGPFAVAPVSATLGATFSSPAMRRVADPNMLSGSLGTVCLQYRSGLPPDNILCSAQCGSRDAADKGGSNGYELFRVLPRWQQSLELGSHAFECRHRLLDRSCHTASLLQQFRLNCHVHILEVDARRYLSGNAWKCENSPKRRAPRGPSRISMYDLQAAS
jgi:hypothetical protein